MKRIMLTIGIGAGLDPDVTVIEVECAGIWEKEPEIINVSVRTAKVADKAVVTGN